MSPSMSLGGLSLHLVCLFYVMSISDAVTECGPGTMIEAGKDVKTVCKSCSTGFFKSETSTTSTSCTFRNSWSDVGSYKYRCDSYGGCSSKSWEVAEDCASATSCVGMIEYMPYRARTGKWCTCLGSYELYNPKIHKTDALRRNGGVVFTLRKISRKVECDDSCSADTCPAGKYTSAVSSATTPPKCTDCAKGFFKSTSSNSTIETDSCTPHTKCALNEVDYWPGTAYRQPECSCLSGFNTGYATMLMLMFLSLLTTFPDL